MPDFSQLLRKPVNNAKRPPALPADDYPGIIRQYEVGDNNQNKTPYVRLVIGLLDWGANTPEEWLVVDANGGSSTVSKSDIDLSRRQMRRDFYLTDDADWRLAELIKSCGIDTGTEDAPRDFEETVPELVGQHVLVEVQQYLNQRTNEIGNQIGRVVGGA